MNRETAHQIVDTMLEFGARLDKLVMLLQRDPQCKDEEYREIRRKIGHLMGSMLIGVMNPIFDQHPDLEPLELAASRNRRNTAADGAATGSVNEYP